MMSMFVSVPRPLETTTMGPVPVVATSFDCGTQQKQQQQHQPPPWPINHGHPQRVPWKREGAGRITSNECFFVSFLFTVPSTFCPGRRSEAPFRCPRKAFTTTNRRSSRGGGEEDEEGEQESQAVHVVSLSVSLPISCGGVHVSRWLSGIELLLLLLLLLPRTKG